MAFSFGSMFSSLFSTATGSGGSSSFLGGLLQAGIMAGAMTLMNGSQESPDQIAAIETPNMSTQFKGGNQLEVQLGDPEKSEESTKRKKKTAKSKFKIARKGADADVGTKALANKTAGVQL